jgi:hypothetical protein
MNLQNFVVQTLGREGPRGAGPWRVSAQLFGPGIRKTAPLISASQDWVELPNSGVCGEGAVQDLGVWSVSRPWRTA